MDRNAVHMDRQQCQVPVIARDFAEITVRPVNRFSQDRFRMCCQPFMPRLCILLDPLLLVSALGRNGFREPLAKKGKNTAGMDKTVVNNQH